jgi:hypothetical protein
MAFTGRDDTYGADAILYDAAELALPGALNDKLQALHFLCGGRVNAVRNWAEGKGDAIVAGVPAESSGYLTLVSQSVYLETAITEPLSGSFVVVSRSPGANANTARPMLIGTNAGSTALDPGAAMWTGSAADCRAGALFKSADSAPVYAHVLAAGPVETSGAWAVRQADFDNTSVTYTNRTENKSVTATPAAGYTRHSVGRKVRIGSAYNVSYLGLSDQAIAAIFSPRLTADEGALFYDWLKRAAATVGLAV